MTTAPLLRTTTTADAGPAEPSVVPSPRAAPVSRPGLRTQMGRFAVIGVVSTVLHLGLFATMTGPLGPTSANLLALLLATVANTAANRWWTFGIRGRANRLRHQLQGLAVFAVTWGATTLGLVALGLVAPTAPVAVQTAVVAVMTGVSTIVRFVALRRWMGR